jgi:hypothetical protein
MEREQREERGGPGRKILQKNNKNTHTENQIEEFSEALRIACEQSFRTTMTARTSQKHKSVPWWTQELTEMRKTANYLRRKYQRTRDNAEQREKTKATYFDQKAKYAATIKREKIKSWKEYCNLTKEANPWNAVYRLAAGKNKIYTQITTLHKSDGPLTRDTKEILRHARILNPRRQRTRRQ